MEFFLERLPIGFFVGQLFGELGKFFEGDPLAVVAKLKTGKRSISD